MKLIAGVVACLALATVGFASARDTGRVVTVRIRNSHFSTDSIEVERGEEVTFVLRNEDPIAHEFIVGDKKVQHVHEIGTEAYHDAIPTEVTIPQGEEVRTTISFDDGGLVDLDRPVLFGCHFPGHYDYGMAGRIRLI
jgi:uncharacterized cupredoxin-like copper-binding protein